MAIDLKSLKPRTVEVTVRSSDGYELTINLRMLSGNEWNNALLKAEPPVKREFITKKMVMKNGKQEETEELNEHGYRRATDEYSNQVSMYRLLAALVGGGDMPEEFIGLSEDKQLEELNSWDSSLLRTLTATMYTLYTGVKAEPFR